MRKRTKIILGVAGAWIALGVIGSAIPSLSAPSGPAWAGTYKNAEMPDAAAGTSTLVIGTNTWKITSGPFADSGTYRTWTDPSNPDGGTGVYVHPTYLVITSDKGDPSAGLPPGTSTQDYPQYSLGVWDNGNLGDQVGLDLLAGQAWNNYECQGPGACTMWVKQ